MSRDLLVDQADADDMDAILTIFAARPGAWRPEWRLHPGSSLVVVRVAESREVVAFAILRCDFERREFIVDALECERGEERASTRGICALAVFGSWIETFVQAHGGGEIFSCVGADNRTHEQALRKVGYEDRVHILSKRVEGAV